LEKAKNHYDLSGFEPKIIRSNLNGMEEEVRVVVRDF